MNLHCFNMRPDAYGRPKQRFQKVVSAPNGRCNHGDMLAVFIMMKTIKIKTLLEVLLRDASG
jgi:hypothetical protein